MKQTRKVAKRSVKKLPAASAKASAADVAPLCDWRTELLARIRKLIHEADPGAVEEVKWRKPSNPAGVPTWSHDGLLCTGEMYKGVLKMTFAQGAALDDPSGLFNASLDGNTRRAIDFREGDRLDERALKALVRAAAARNATAKGSDRPKRSSTKRK
jgi:hypothetical protein